MNRWLMFVFGMALLAIPHAAPLQAKEVVQPLAGLHQTSDAAPYLMAFSVEPSPHFVIERADGTDSRIFANNVMPAETNHVSGAGWSPSGEWFAWTASILYKETNTGDSPFVLSADGQTHLTALDDMNRMAMAWSPTEDILLVAGLVNPPRIQLNPETHIFETVNEADTLTMRIGLFDPATDSFLQVQELPAPFVRNDLVSVNFRVFWTADGAMGAVRPTGYDRTNLAGLNLYTITPQGDFATRPIDLPPLEDGSTPRVFISPQGDIATLWPPTELRIQPLQGDTGVISLPPTNAIEEAWWSPDSQYLLLHTITTPETPEIQAVQEIETVHRLWAWSRSTNSLVELFDGADGQGPSSLDLINPSPDFSYVFYVRSTPDGNIAQVSDLAGAKTLIFEEAPAPETLVLWNHTGQVAYELAASPAKSLVGYDVTGEAALKLGTVEMGDSYNDLPALSPHASTIGQIWRTLDLITLATGEVRHLPMDSRGYFTATYGEMEWHPSLGWAFRFEDAVVAGGGYLRYTGIVNEAGTVRRPLGYCQSPTPICLGWLPAQVDLAMLTAGTDNRLPSPRTTIDTGYWMDELIWSPDGTQIASTTDWRWWGDASPYEVWQVDTQNSQSAPVKIATFADVGWDQTIAWQDGAAQVVNYETRSVEYAIYDLAISADGSLTARFVTPPDADDVWLELVDAEGNVRWSVAHSGYLWHDTVSFSADGRWLAVASAETPVRILDVQTGEIVGGLPLIYSNGIAFSPDGTRLAVAEATVIQIYAVADLLHAD